VRDSKHLKDILEIILAVGNYMNDSSKQANGFKLGTLQRLAFTKDDKNTMTFLHYVEKIVRTSFPHLETFCDDLKDAIDASKISIEQVKSDCDEFMQMIKNVQTSVDIGNLSDPTKFHPQDKVLSIVLSSLPEARKKREYLGDQLKTTVTEFNKLMKYFGEDPSDNTASSTFFSKFSFFVSEFQRAKQENLQREQENRAYEAQKRLREAPKKSSQLESGNISGPSSPGQSGSTESAGNQSVMDNLLEKLKAAGPSGDARSARRRAAARKTMAEHRRALLNQNAEGGGTGDDVPQIKVEPEDDEKSSEGGGRMTEIVEIKEEDEPSEEHNQPRRKSSAAAEENEVSEANLNKLNASEDNSATLERSASVASESVIPSPSKEPSETNEDDDVGGRARKLLEELRSGASGNGDYRRPGSLSSASGGSKLAERRARKVQQLKNRSQGSFDLKALKSEVASPSQSSDNNDTRVSATSEKTLSDSSPTKDQIDKTEVIEIEDTPVNSPSKEEEPQQPQNNDD
jgi:cytokinesis protein